MRKIKISGYQIFLFFVVGWYSGTFAQKNPFIFVEAIDRHHLHVENIGGFPLMFYIDKIAPEGIFLPQKDYEDYIQTFIIKKLNPSSELYIRYPKQFFEQQMAYFDNLEKRYQNELKFRHGIDSIIEDYPVKVPNESPITGEDRDNINGFIEFLTKGLSSYMDYQAIKEFRYKMKKVNEDRKKYKAIYAASWGKETNKYSHAFRKITLKELIINSKKAKSQVIPHRYINVSGALPPDSPGNNWHYGIKNGGPFTGFSLGASFYQKLFFDINWVRNFYSSFFVGASYDFYANGLKTDDKEVFVHGDYVKEPNQAFYLIKSENQTNLKIHNFSTSLLLHNYVFNSFYIDFGVGYYFYQMGTLQFNDVSNDFVHLSPNAELKKVNYRDVVNFENQSPWHGLVNVGYKSYVTGGKRSIDVTMFARILFFKRNIEPNEKFKLYEDVSNNEYQKIRISDAEKDFYQLRFGVGISL